MNLKVISWRRIGAWALALTVPLLSIIIITIILIGGSSETRSFLIEARTTGLHVKFAGSNNIWPLGPATICKPLDRPNRAGKHGDDLCDERLFDLSREDDFLLEFSSGGEAFIGSNHAGGLDISVSGIRMLPDNTRILLNSQSWQSVGALAFSGNVTIGGQMGSGQQRFLLSGRYEVRESPRISYGRDGRVDVIKSGQLLRGEQINIVTPKGPSAVVGHITPVMIGDVGMNAVIVSLPGNTSMSLSHIGGDSVSTIKPDWIDHAKASPILIAMTFILTVLIGAGQLLFDAVGYLRTSPDQKKQDNDMLLEGEFELSGDNIEVGLETIPMDIGAEGGVENKTE